jgi:3-deoxy-manno-octulosonate cytidylyltransferase (CMP-KDO synthetase)
MTSPEPMVSVCIPARQGSSRFPGKPLAQLAGKPLIQHVYEAAQQVAQVGQIIVVTDHDVILQTVRDFGGEVCLVTEPCRTGTDRVAKTASQLTHDVVVNLQADEVLLHPGLLSDLIQPFLNSGARIGTLKRKLQSGEDRANPSIVKVVTDYQGRALYFSRSAVPCWRDGIPAETDSAAWMHLGIYIFQKAALQQFSELPSGFLEEAEKLEQLRALEYGMPIMVWETAHESLRIDTPEDLAMAESFLLAK